MDSIGVLIVDDHHEFRAGLRELLAAVPDIDVVGEAQDGERAIDLAARLQPAVVLMDVHLPGLGGIEATSRIVRPSPHIRVLVLSRLDDVDSLFASLRAGARGYVVKGARRSEIVRSIRAVAAGEVIFGPGIANQFIHYFSAAPRTTLSTSVAFPELTARECEVLVLAARHQTNPEIARHLKLSPKTVRNHVSNIFTKLGVATRAEAIIRARDAGLR